MTAASHTKTKPMVKAPAIKKNECVGLICPASRPNSPALLKRSVQVVEEMGFKPVIGKNAFESHGYMAGTDEQRLEDLNGFLHDDSIRGVFCVSGGFGSQHLLPGLDYDYIATHPKVIVGGEDNDSLLLAINSRSGLVTFHGPNLDQVVSTYSFDRLAKTVSSTTLLPPVSAQDREQDKVVANFVYSPVKGIVEGSLLGGNLTALCALMGTPYQPDLNDCVLFLDDHDERNDILDRWFTNLWVSGQLSSVQAVVLGEFVNCDTRGSNNMLSVEELFGDRLSKMQLPCCFGMPVGQGQNVATLPLGISVQFDAAQGKLEFKEAALI